MDETEFFKDYRDFVIFRPDRYGKATLFANEQMLVGLNCLEPGQAMEKHAHALQCRFYIVLEGQGQIWIDEQRQETENGTVTWILAGHAHRILNFGETRLVLLVGITPSKAD
jgi:quercetin dioxygenase-like cupin family protein